jgi:hypothetical protein
MHTKEMCSYITLLELADRSQQHCERESRKRARAWKNANGGERTGRDPLSRSGINTATLYFATVFVSCWSSALGTRKKAGCLFTSVLLRTV